MEAVTQITRKSYERLIYADLLTTSISFSMVGFLKSGWMPCYDHSTNQLPHGAMATSKMRGPSSMNFFSVSF